MLKSIHFLFDWQDVKDIEKLMPGYLSVTVEFFRSYKVPAGKPKNQFAFGGQAKGPEFALEIIEETSQYWKELSLKRINNDGGLALYEFCLKM